MRMQRSNLKSLALTALLLAGTWGVYQAGASAPVVPPPPAAAIATVDMEALMKGLAEITARNADFKSINEARQKELNGIMDRAEKLTEELKLLKPDAKELRTKTAELYELRELGQTKQKIFQRLSAFEEGDIIRSIYIKAQATIAKVAAKDGYSLVLLDDRNAKLRPEGTGIDMSDDIMRKKVLYASESVDITSRIITEMNNEYSAPAPRPAAGK